jgi:hypothetical protein
MASYNQIASYPLDTLQIYFAWDDDLYTHLKQRGFGQSGFERKTLPIIYSDNCESTTGVHERKRKYVINPNYFGKTYEELGWKRTDKETEPIIGSEQPRLSVLLSDDKTNLKFCINPRADEKEQYHLEYSTMAAFGRLYTNWVIPVLTINDFNDLLPRLERTLSMPSTDFLDIEFHEEKKQNQRERLFFVEVPVYSYKFSIGEFQHARDFLAHNGVKGILPSLVFTDTLTYLQKMQPVLKLGFVHTAQADGFEIRKRQCALKLAQPKMTMSLRGKRSKTKGMIELQEHYENYFIVPATKFTVLAKALSEK